MIWINRRNNPRANRLTATFVIEIYAPRFGEGHRHSQAPCLKDSAGAHAPAGQDACSQISEAMRPVILSRR